MVPMRNKLPIRRRKKAPPPESITKTPWLERARQSLHRFRHFLITARQKTKESIDWLANALFDTTVASGRFRRWLFIGLGAIVWGLSAFLNNPPTGESNFFIYPLQTLFHAKVLRHVLVAGLSFWLALKVSSIYLDDVFELENPEIAERYILQASVANLYPQIEISDGKVEDREESTIVSIGGPGLVRLHYDSAALFEKYDGDPTVIIAEDPLVALDRFERLRRVVRLRDHIDETKISTRTRDGIPVSADGVRLKYHILRDEDQVREGKIPYPVVRKAVENLVYRESVHKRLNPLSINPKPENNGPGKHPETLNISANPILSRLGNFIADATLSEFLATISEPEMTQLIEDSKELERDALSLSGAIPVSETDNGREKPQASSTPEFRPRSAITDEIYNKIDQLTRLTTGLKLEWIDIGTWVLPKQAREIVKQHEEAWRQSLVNLQTRSDAALEITQTESKIKATRAILHEIIYEYRSMEYQADDQKIIDALLNQYLQKLGLAQDIRQKQARAKPRPHGITKLHSITLADDPDDITTKYATPRPIVKAIHHLLSFQKTPDPKK
jgi:hypothetical protein